MDPYCVENKHRVGDLKKKLESLLSGGSESEKHAARKLMERGGMKAKQPKDAPPPCAHCGC
jgi:hypothetical protein